nr:RHS repeat-associated core domain-containing protein [uncultured Carboxylicivirga sp.]
MRGFLVLAIGDYEIYHKFANDVLETERTTVNISDDKKKIATAETLTVDQGSLTVNPVAVIRYQYDNHLGSASLELDEQANIISYEEYHPFGTTSYRSGRTETETSQKRYKYVGKERDEETGLYYYGFRYYAAWLCRFVSVDPLQFEYPHYTPFQYAGNKPISYIDLDGLEEAQPDEDYKVGDVRKNDDGSLQEYYFNPIAERNEWVTRLPPGVAEPMVNRNDVTRINKQIDPSLTSLTKLLNNKYEEKRIVDDVNKSSTWLRWLDSSLKGSGSDAPDRMFSGGDGFTIYGSGTGLGQSIRTQHSTLLTRADYIPGTISVHGGFGPRAKFGYATRNSSLLRTFSLDGLDAVKFGVGNFGIGDGFVNTLKNYNGEESTSYIKNEINQNKEFTKKNMQQKDTMIH